MASEPKKQRSFSVKFILENLPGGPQLTMGVLALTVMQLFRPEQAPLVIVFSECLIYALLPFVFLGLLRGQIEQTTVSNRRFSRNAYFQLSGFAFAVMPLATQATLRNFGIGDAYEIVAILCILNLAWFATVFAKVAKSQNLSFVLNSSVVLFVCFATQSVAVYVGGFFYSVIALWWLLENYWNRLQPNKLDAETTSLPIRGFALGTTITLLVVVGVCAAAAGPVGNLISVDGFMPSSGGENGYDDMYARSGVGDGDMLTTGENATAEGALDTDQFIEGKKPSIYDVVSEKYDGPTKIKKKMSAAQSLNEIAKHVHNVKQAEQSGRTFRTVRESKKTYDRKMEDRISDALFYVEGKVPTRFRVDCFQHWDGWDWKKTEQPESILPEIRMENHAQIPWFVLQKKVPDYLYGDQHHQIKILRLESETLPSPPSLQAWHITKVNRKDLFHWNDYGLVKILSDTIPSQTVIDTISRKTDHYELRAIDSKSFHVSAGEDLTQVPQNEMTSRIQKLTDRIVDGIEPGWRQVEAIAHYLKTEMILDEEAVVDEDSSDSVGWFLDQGRGPSYLFATTAVQMLRCAGFQARYATGFVVESKHYIRKSGQSIVARENFHVWPEVCIDGRYWIPVEPTPGFQDPIGYGSLWQRAIGLVGETIRLARRNPLWTLGILCLVVAVVGFRRYWMAFFAWCYWKLLFWGDARKRLKVTRQLIDARLWLFDAPRPRFAVIRDWFQKVDSELPNDFFDIWNQTQFGSPDQNLATQDVESACRQLVAQLNLSKIKNFAKQEI